MFEVKRFIDISRRSSYARQSSMDKRWYMMVRMSRGQVARSSITKMDIRRIDSRGMTRFGLDSTLTGFIGQEFRRNIRQKMFK